MFKQILVLSMIIGFLGGLVYLSFLFNENLIGVTFSDNQKISKEYNLTRDFQKVKVDIDMDIELIQGNETRLVIEATSNFFNEATFRQSSKTLSFEKKSGFHANLNFSQGETTRPKVLVFFKKLEEIETSGNVKLVARKLETENLNIFYKGNGSIIINEFTGKKLGVVNDGTGFVNVGGKTENLSLNAVNKGYSNLQELDSLKTTATLTNIGNAHVRAKNTLFTNITGSGELVYSGSPQITSAQGSNLKLKQE